ncbi:MAG: GTP cyclohydrolase I FolE, partial [Oligoflexus sp.]
MRKELSHTRAHTLDLPKEPEQLSEVSRETSRALQKQSKAVDAARKILELTGEDLGREGLKDTPQRFAKAYQSLLGGYSLTPAEAVGKGVFASEGNGLVSVEDVEFYSMCEHHLLPFWGKATVAYFPDKKILGLSKIPRIVDIYARRVQVQERITQQVMEAVRDLIAPRAILVRIEAQHLCMMMR